MSLEKNNNNYNFLEAAIIGAQHMSHSSNISSAFVGGIISPILETAQ